jgi:cysteine desulfurase / selenocysteine lyase
VSEKHKGAAIGPTGLVQCCRGDGCGPRVFDPVRLRKDFPILEQTIHGDKKLAYLDNAATTQKPAAVVCALCDYYQLCNANVHRSLHYLAEQATQRFEAARASVARFIHAPETRTIIFTRGTTESINVVAYGWGRKFLKRGDEIIATEMEHHSNLVPWQQVAQVTGAKLRLVPVLEDGTLDLEDYRGMLSSRTKLVAFTHISNVLGTVNPAAAMIKDARALGAVTLLDAAQSAPQLAIDVQDLGCDFLVFSGHKMLAPTGIGVLYGRAELLLAMDPFMYGGEMISRVTADSATWADLPQKFEAGTPNIGGAIGLGAAVEYIESLGLDKVSAYQRELTAHAMKTLGGIPGLRIFGHAPERGGEVSFEVDGVHPHDLAQFVDRDGVAIRAGHLCAQPLMRKLGVPAVSRASVYLYNLKEEIDRLAESILKAKEFFIHGIR